MTFTLLLPLGIGSCTTLSLQGGGDSTENNLMGLGRTVFIELSEPRCGACHVLKDAGTRGMIGPDLDAMGPDADRVITAVSGGVGVMGAQEHLTDQEVKAVAHYVAMTTNGMVYSKPRD